MLGSFMYVILNLFQNLIRSRNKFGMTIGPLARRVTFAEAMVTKKGAVG